MSYVHDFQPANMVVRKITGLWFEVERCRIPYCGATRLKRITEDRARELERKFKGQRSRRVIKPPTFEIEIPMRKKPLPFPYNQKMFSKYPEFRPP